MATTTAARLKEIMQQRDLRQADILRLAQPYCEKYKIKLGKSDLSQFVNGKSSPGQWKLTILGLALNVSEAWLMGLDVPMDRVESDSLPAPNLKPVPDTYRVPRLGVIACGTPILAEQNIETYDRVPTTIRCDFTLVCRGDSMVGAGIEDGDIVYIREQPEVETGEIAAVMVGDDEATLKRFKRIGNTILLIPENSDYEPMIFTAGEMNGVRILGKAVAFTRYFYR